MRPEPDPRIECRNCGLIYDAQEHEGVCPRCNPRAGDCPSCGESKKLAIVQEDGVSYCSRACEIADYPENRKIHRGS